jgi:hypothetical protein
MAGKQSLFWTDFEGPHGSVIYEQMPRARSRGTIFGRGLEGSATLLLKPFGL